MSSADLPQIIGGLALLIGTVFTGVAAVTNARDKVSQRDRKRLEQYEEWRPIVRRVVAELRGILADHRIPEPAGLDEQLRFPPANEKVPADDDPA